NLHGVSEIGRTDDTLNKASGDPKTQCANADRIAFSPWAGWIHVVPDIDVIIECKCVAARPATHTDVESAGRDTTPGVDAHSHVVIARGDTREHLGVQKSHSHVPVAGDIRSSIETKDAIGNAVNVSLERLSADSRVEASVGASAGVVIQK